MTSSTFMTSAEAAAALRVSTREIARRVQTGRLVPAQKLPGLRGAFLFNAADIAAQREDVQ